MKLIYARMNEWRLYVLSILRIVAPLLFLEHGYSKLFDFPVPGPPFKAPSFSPRTLKASGDYYCL
jgi:uncharacterized membrane protein YphA (DoxX/SURF4 family)